MEPGVALTAPRGVAATRSARVLGALYAGAVCESALGRRIRVGGATPSLKDTLGVLHHKRLGHGRQLTLNVESQLPPTPLTTAEAECLFFFVQFSLSGLVSGEIKLVCRLKRVVSGEVKLYVV